MQSFHCTRGTHKKVWRPYSPWDLPQYERQQLDLNKRKWSVSVFISDLIARGPVWSLGDVILYFALMLKPLTSFHCSPVCISIMATGYSNGPANAPDAGCGSDLRRRPQFHRAGFTSVQPRSRCSASSQKRLDKLLLFPLRALRFIGSAVMRLQCWWQNQSVVFAVSSPPLQSWVE